MSSHIIRHSTLPTSHTITRETEAVQWRYETDTMCVIEPQDAMMALQLFYRSPLHMVILRNVVQAGDAGNLQDFHVRRACLVTNPRHPKPPAILNDGEHACQTDDSWVDLILDFDDQASVEAGALSRASNHFRIAAERVEAMTQHVLGSFSSLFSISPSVRQTQDWFEEPEHFYSTRPPVPTSSSGLTPERESE